MKQHQFLSLFTKPKPIIGMVHLAILAGQKGFCCEDYVIKQAKYDIAAWQEGRIDGLIIENWQEDALGVTIPKIRVDSMVRVVTALGKFIHVPFGINVLNNDYHAAYMIAKKTNANFVQFDVLVDSVVSNFVYNREAQKYPFAVNVDTKDVYRCAAKYGLTDLPILCGIHPKHYRMLDAAKTLEQSALEAAALGVGGIVITKATGVAPMAELFEKAKRVVKTPLGVGSGLTDINAHELLQYADFAIVGTFAKKDGITDRPVDVVRVKRLMQVVYDMANAE